ncbi:MAG: hypothetical protein JNN08_25580 [Bryobacterales bacterium]|nr:hypothetical protein [Bryobacterales bacterium]
MRLIPLALLAAALAAAESLEDWRIEKTIPLQASLHHVQGIDVEGGRLWVSSVERKTRKGFLSLFELTSGRLVRQVEVQDGDQFHPGGIARQGDWIWVPVAEYRRASSATIQKRHKESLELLDRFPVADHIGCIAAGEGQLIGGNWDSRIFYVWDERGKLLAKRDNPRPTGYQDLKRMGATLIGSGLLSRREGAIEWLSLPEFTLSRQIVTGITDRGVPFTNEGMAFAGGKLYLLPEDDPSRLFVFAPR